MNLLIEDPVAFFSSLGGLHDADIERATWTPRLRTFEIEVDDLNSNFDGLPGYAGKRPALLMFEQVRNLDFSCDGLPSEVQRIYRLEIQQAAAGRASALLLISPSGRVCFEFEKCVISDAQ